MQVRFRQCRVALAASLVCGTFASSALAGNPERDAYFGETHVHTSWSLDAWLLGNRTTGPADAYKYFKGEPIKHPAGYDVKIVTPLDWAGVTDHSEYVGVIKYANDPNSPVSKLAAAQPLKINPDKPAAEEGIRIFNYAAKVLFGGPPVKALMDPKVSGTVWKETIAAAQAANEPGKFTAFCSYEWTSMPNNMNMHRNIFFKECHKVPETPFSALDSSNPEDLWNWMDGERKKGNELLAISHNANISDGRMYPTEVDLRGRPIDAAWAESRMRNERLTEIHQIKGTSETHPLLSPNDEFASFEIMQFLIGDPPGRTPQLVGSFARQALKDGVAMQGSKGFNPYKFGFGAAADSHNTAVAYRQQNWFGAHALTDATPQIRMSGQIAAGMDPRNLYPAGLTGVWAEENTRASLFEGMQRKETFAVSGPQIKVRLFGGWDYTPEVLNDAAWVKTGYAKGVPMGGDLPVAKGKAPNFIVWAVKDPSSGHLDRIQIIKGWTQNGQSFEKIYDVVWAGDRKRDKWTHRVPAIQSTVDLDKATYSNSLGAAELKAVWSDPDFDASQHAFYYARAIEIPTPRWTLIQAVKSGLPPPDIVPLTGQERAWSSPIWYAPSAEARKAAVPGMTVAELKKKGASELNDAQLKALVVGKAVWIKNNVTGEQYWQPFTAEGQTTVFRVGTNAVVPSAFGSVERDGYQGTTGPYRIEGGKLVIPVSQHPYAVTLYKLGNTTYAARSNEFGYANYEIIEEAPQIALNPLTAVANQFSLELALTEEQRKQIVPILLQEIKQLGELKKDTKLSGLDKVKRLREIGVSFDDQLKPLLNADQQQKFQTLREDLRRRLIETAAEQAVDKLKTQVSTFFPGAKK